MSSASGDLLTLIASLLFALCLPILLTDFYRATFKFFCVVYGFLLVVHLVRIAIAQNISIARSERLSIRRETQGVRGGRGIPFNILTLYVSPFTFHVSR